MKANKIVFFFFFLKIAFYLLEMTPNPLTPSPPTTNKTMTSFADNGYSNWIVNQETNSASHITLSCLATSLADDPETSIHVFENRAHAESMKIM